MRKDVILVQKWDEGCIIVFLGILWHKDFNCMRELCLNHFNYEERERERDFDPKFHGKFLGTTT